MRNVMALHVTLTLVIATSLAAAQGGRGGRVARVDCPGRPSFHACYLTTEDPLQRNFAILYRGLEVELLGRAGNGRWLVRLPEPSDRRVVPIGGWPGDGQPVGWVSPRFVVEGGDQASSGSGAIDLLGTGRSTGAAPAPTATPAPDPPRAQGFFPPRPAGAPTGSQFLAQTRALSRPAREAAILEQLSRGNVPDHLRLFREVTVQAQGTGGVTHRGVFFAAPDYLAIGTNEDYVRIPMAPATAEAVCRQLGCMLPTTVMVDRIWEQAVNRLTPRPLPASAQMMSNDYYGRANALVQEQMNGRSAAALTAGDKKDVVVSNRLVQRPGKVAIYGWHRPDGTPWQGLSTVHEASYADYSHGARLVQDTMLVDGAEWRVERVLRDPVLCRLVSNEGTIQRARY